MRITPEQLDEAIIKRDSKPVDVWADPLMSKKEISMRKQIIELFHRHWTPDTIIQRTAQGDTPTYRKFVMQTLKDEGLV